MRWVWGWGWLAGSSVAGAVFPPGHPGNRSESHAWPGIHPKSSTRGALARLTKFCFQFVLSNPPKTPWDFGALCVHGFFKAKCLCALKAMQLAERPKRPHLRGWLRSWAKQRRGRSMLSGKRFASFCCVFVSWFRVVLVVLLCGFWGIAGSLFGGKASLSNHSTGTGSRSDVGAKPWQSEGHGGWGEVGGKKHGLNVLYWILLVFPTCFCLCFECFKHVLLGCSIILLLF